MSFPIREQLYYSSFQPCPGKDCHAFLLAFPEPLYPVPDLSGDQILVGFAAETEKLVEHARAKLRLKNLDLIIANDLTAADAGFASDTNRVTILWPDGRAESLPLQDKDLVAGEVWDRVEGLWKG